MKSRATSLMTSANGRLRMEYNPELRIALCGYDQHEAELPASWTRVYWKANGGFSNQKKSGTRGQENARRETLYFSRLFEAALAFLVGQPRF